jgi:hypothetical protein
VDHTQDADDAAVDCAHSYISQGADCADCADCEFGINLNDKIRQGLGEVKLGDVKDFTLKVKIQTGTIETASLN